MNGSGERITPTIQAKAIPPRNYKLIVDPFITGKKEPKLYRYEGMYINDQVTTVIVRDPRVRLASFAKIPADLPVPRCDKQIFNISNSATISLFNCCCFYCYSFSHIIF